MPPADASPAATDRPDPSARAAVDRSGAGGATVPPPRSAPDVEATPERAADSGAERAAPSSPVATPPATSEAASATAASGMAAPGTAATAGRETAGPDGGSGEDGGTERSPAGQADALTERERHILAFEQQWWKHAGAKEQAIRDTFGLSATRYYQLLNALLDHPAALAAEPVLVGRLRRLRSSRARNRRR